ncbi:transcription termination factor 1 isoform X1 [Podarcis raffonei]|uniref:transcription termination factor 1 isoform X1 n=1 Tax=Podarcis raffonei TaxID=65483 RepID=UPI002329111D|nr:transcription termination factor 1 isoform X1 [Podarcis raffonei]
MHQEIMHSADASSASNGFHFPELVKKKKKKKKKRKEGLNGQGDDQPVEAAPCSPPSSGHSSILTWLVEDTEATGACRKKTKNIKPGKEIPDSESDATWIPTDSELNSKSGTDTRVCNKKKRKYQLSEQEGGRDFCIPETPEKASSLHPVVPLMQRLDLSLQEKKQTPQSDKTAEFCSPIARKKKKKRKKAETSEEASSQLEASDLENAGYVSESTPVQKKKKAKVLLLTEQAEANGASDRLTDIRAHPPSLHKHNRTDCSDKEDTQKDLFAPSPPAVLLTQHSDLSQEERKEATESDKTVEFCSPIARKRKKRKKAETPEEASSQLDASDLENAGYVSESTPVQKKKKAKVLLLTEQAEANGASDRLNDIRAHPPSLHKHNRTDCSDTEDTQKDLFAPSPPAVLVTQHSDLSQEERKEATESDKTVEFCSPIARKKKKKHKKAETPEEASSQLDASDLENAGLHKHNTTNCSDTEDVKEDFFTPLPPPEPLTQPSDLPQEENNEVNKLDRTVNFSSPTTQKKSHKRRNAPSTNASDGGVQKSPTPVHSDAEESSSSKFSLVDNEFVEFSQLSMKDLDSATKELEEFIPHIRTLSDSAIRQLAGRDLVRFRNFKKKGVAVRFGKFSRKENNQLRHNIEAFLKDTGIESAEKLLFAHRFPQERESINKLKTKNLFGAKIAQGIPRPWRLVYYRARKMYDPKNYNGRYTELEKKKLKKYQAMYGNNWKKISDLMSRSSHSVETKFSEIKCAYNSGPWGSEETRKLVQAIKETLLSKMRDSDPASEKEDEDGALMVTYENLWKGISWSKVEAKVGTRHWRQCKQKWINIVTKTFMGKRTKRSRLEHLRINIALIERLYEVDADDVEEVDWEEIASAIGNVPPYYIRSRFYRTKAYRVPHWNNRSFMEIMTHLYEVTLPMLKKQQAELMARKNITVEPQQVEDHSWKRVFKFSDIFHDSDYISDDDSDDDQEN